MKERRPLVIVETPYGANGDEAILNRNIRYAQLCLKDCINRGEAPFASHLLYTQKHVLNDDDANERHLGIELGLSWCQVANKTVVYTDFGISPGMEHGVEYAMDLRKTVEYRKLPYDILLKYFAADTNNRL